MNIVQAVQTGLRTALIESAIKNELIDVHKYARGIGKTTALIEFAKSYDFNVIVNNPVIVKGLQDYYGYEKIYSENQVREKPMYGSCVIDEGVSLNDLPCRVVTGFQTI